MLSCLLYHLQKAESLFIPHFGSILARKLLCKSPTRNAKLGERETFRESALGVVMSRPRDHAKIDCRFSYLKAA